MKKKQTGGMEKSTAAAIVLALLITGGLATSSDAQDSKASANPGGHMTADSKFYCNIKALNLAERARHQQLSDKLVAARTATVETENGYEFQYSPSNVSLAELAEWAEAESKCCPFFDFHIDLEREGTLLCLRLTGDEGIKLFIRAEFQVPAK
jgi:hypothetical protein